MVRAMIAEWPECLKACVEAESGHLSDIIINKNLKLLVINYLARKTDVLFHFPSRSQHTCNRIYSTNTKAACSYKMLLFI